MNSVLERLRSANTAAATAVPRRSQHAISTHIRSVHRNRNQPLARRFRFEAGSTGLCSCDYRGAGVRGPVKLGVRVRPARNGCDSARSDKDSSQPLSWPSPNHEPLPKMGQANRGRQQRFSMHVIWPKFFLPCSNPCIFFISKFQKY